MSAHQGFAFTALPPELAVNTSLEVFDVSGGWVGGPLPPELSRWSNLTVFK